LAFELTLAGDESPPPPPQAVRKMRKLKTTKIRIEIDSLTGGMDSTRN